MEACDQIQSVIWKENKDCLNPEREDINNDLFYNTPMKNSSGEKSRD